MDTSALETIPCGSGSARRPCSRIHRCAQANAASSCSSTHEEPSGLMRRRWKRSPVGRAPPDASVPGFTTAPKPTPRRAAARPTKGLGNGCVGAGNDPPWVGLRPTPAFLDSPLRPSQRHVEPQLDPRRASWTDASALETIPRGSSSARRARSWTHCVAHGASHLGLTSDLRNLLPVQMS